MRRQSLRRVSLKMADDELRQRQSISGLSLESFPGRRESFQQDVPVAAPARRQSRRDSWNFGTYEDEMDGKILGFDELKNTLDTTFEAFEGIQSLEIVRTALIDVMGRFRATVGELERYALFDYSKPYTRNCVAHTDKYTLLLLCWNPAAESRIHDHPCDACILTVLEGILKEERYATDIENTVPRPIGTRFYLPHQVSYMRDEIGLHKIINPNKSAPSISLHLYYPPFASCACWVQDHEGRVLRREEVKIGTFSHRGIRTPLAEGRMSTHSQVMVELTQKAKVLE